MGGVTAARAGSSEFTPVRIARFRGVYRGFANGAYSGDSVYQTVVLYNIRTTCAAFKFQCSLHCCTKIGSDGAMNARV